jgi:hypothetical protein
MGVAEFDEARALGMLRNASFKAYGAHFVEGAA